MSAVIQPVYPVEPPAKPQQRRRLYTAGYTSEVADKICVLLMQKWSLRKICERPGMPSMRVVTRWLMDPKRADFREAYYLARRVQAEILIDEIFEIADDKTGDYKIETGVDGVQKVVADNDHIQRARIRIDTRKWFAGKMVPKIYGDRQQIDHEVVGDLKELLEGASNQQSGLPPPIEGETE